MIVRKLVTVDYVLCAAPKYLARAAPRKNLLTSRTTPALAIAGRALDRSGNGGSPAANRSSHHQSAN